MCIGAFTLVALICATARTSAAPCDYPMNGVVLPGMYSLESSLANQVHHGMPGPAPEPARTPGVFNVTHGAQAQIVDVVPASVWKSRYRSMILKTNLNNQKLSLAQRMRSIGDDAFLQIRDSNGHLWWIDSHSIVVNGKLFWNNGKLLCAP